MTATMAVLYYAAWTLALALLYALPRVPQVLLRLKPADAWSRDKPPADPTLLVRAHHAHLNSLENFPIFAGVVAMALLMDRAAAVDSLAAYVLYARVAQSLVHLSGTSFIQVLLRATLFLTQVLLTGLMIWHLLSA